jgi:hypothetical protein
MKKLVKTISVCLIIVLTLGFTACKGKKTDTNNYSPANKDKSIDLNGRTIKVGLYEEMIPENNNSQSSDELTKRINNITLQRKQDAEKKFNCKIEWSTNYSKIFSSINRGLPSGADIVYCSQYDGIDFITLVRDKYIIPLDNYIDYNNGVYSSEVQNCSLFRGKQLDGLI